MLQIYTKDGYVPIESRQEYYYLQNYNGFHELYFDVSIKDSIMRHLKNEAIILNEDNRFLIKDINRRTQNATIKCELDLDEWKQTVFFDTATDTRFQTKTIGEIFDVIKPQGWKINNVSVRTIRRTIELQDVQPYDIMMEIQKIYSVVYDINVENKTVNLINPDMYTFNGLYATPELNLREITWQGNSDDFCTRLFAYGKIDDNGIPVSIKSVNNGKEYVENHTYSDKVITKVWRDERYTDPQTLYDDVVKKLNELSVPRMSYDVSIVDLQKMNEEYNFLAFGLYEIVKTIIDENTFIEQKVVTYKRYYDKPDKNVITLSNEKQTFTSKVSNVLGGSPNEILNGSFLDQAKQESANLINSFTTRGLKYETENETYYLDKLPKEAAKYVMRMNLGGIAFSTNGWAGPYTTAWTIDGKFNADFISTGTLQAIKILGGSININDKFTVDENGKLKCIDGEFSGKITSESGLIGGFSITKDGLIKTTMVQLAKVYTKSDLDRIQNIIMGNVSPTSEDYRLYDINKDGKITVSDLLRIEQVFVPIQSDKLFTDVVINSYPYNPNNINQPMLLVRYRGESGKVAMSSEISARKAIVQFFEAVSITAKDILCYNGDGSHSFITDNIGICAKNGGAGNQISCGSLYGGSYSGSDNIYLYCDSGYLAFYSAGNAVYYNGNYIDENWSAGKFYPSTNGKVALGTSGNRWYRLYSSNASSESSDERLKTNITNFDERYIKLFEMLEPIMYNWIEHSEENKEAGLIAQKVQEAMKECEITDEEFGCIDYSGEKEYLGLIYRHFFILTMYYIQCQKNSFEKYKEDIEKRLNRLEGLHGNNNNE